MAKHRKNMMITPQDASFKIKGPYQTKHVKYKSPKKGTDLRNEKTGGPYPKG